MSQYTKEADYNETNCLLQKLKLIYLSLDVICSYFELPNSFLHSDVLAFSFYITKIFS